jgi:hypothetical protein
MLPGMHFIIALDAAPEGEVTFSCTVDEVTFNSGTALLEPRREPA